MTERGGFNLERFAGFVVNNADEFPQCLSLIKEAFQALSTAERKIELLKECFLEHREKMLKNKSKPSVATSSDDYDGNSTMVSTSSVTENLTEAEDAEPTKKKRKKKSSLREGSDSDINAASHQNKSGQSNAGSGHSSQIPISKNKNTIVDKPTGELGVQSSPIPESSIEESEELIFETDDEKKVDVLMDTATDEKDPLSLMNASASSEAPTEGSVSSRASSTTPRKRRSSICANGSSESVIPSCSRQLEFNGNQVPSLVDSEGTSQTVSCKNEPISVEPSAFNQTGSPALRVIPSALLMENPEQLEAKPLETDITPGSSGLQKDAVVPRGNDALESGENNRRNKPSILYFEFDRDVDSRKCTTHEDVRIALKSLGLEDFEVINIDRSIPHKTSCKIEFRTKDFYRILFTNELVINGVKARMTTSRLFPETLDGISLPVKAEQCYETMVPESDSKSEIPIAILSRSGSVTKAPTSGPNTGKKEDTKKFKSQRNKDEKEVKRKSKRQRKREQMEEKRKKKSQTNKRIQMKNGTENATAGSKRKDDSSEACFTCHICGRSYKQFHILKRHKRYECGRLPQFQCPKCPYKGKTMYSIHHHLAVMHAPLE